MPLGGTGRIKVDNPPRSEPDVIRHMSRAFLRRLVGVFRFKWRQEEEVERAWCPA